MLTQEEYVQRVLELKRQGWSVKEIASEVGYHPATVSKWLKAGGPPEKRSVNPAVRVIDDRWARRIDTLIAPPSKLLSTSVFEIITAEGYPGSYPSVVRQVRARRGPRFRVAPQVSVPIETAPGEESQFDFSDCSERGRQFGIADTLWCFGAVLCWSRDLFWWFTTSVDREHTMEGLVRHFEYAGGVPRMARTDRMGALGTSQGKRFLLHPPTLDFAAHHGVEIKACQARDAKRKAWTTDCSSCSYGWEDVVHGSGVIAGVAVERILPRAAGPRKHRSDSSHRTTCDEGPGCSAPGWAFRTWHRGSTRLAPAERRGVPPCRCRPQRRAGRAVRGPSPSDDAHRVHRSSPRASACPCDVAGRSATRVGGSCGSSRPSRC